MTITLEQPDVTVAARIIEQNIAYHEATADLYDLSHPELRHAFERVLLRQDLDCIARLLEVACPLALDIGAGTGRLTLQFTRQGWDCLAIDNSPAMLAVLQRRYDRLPMPRGRLETVCAGADDFDPKALAGRPVHLIGFSSVLHHLPDYLAVVRHFAQLLAPGGVLYVTHEPLPTQSHEKNNSSRLVKVMDQLLRAPQQAHRALVKAHMRIIPPTEAALVDYHDKPGLDMKQLRAVLDEEGLTVMREQAYKDRKTALMAWLDTRWFRTPNWRFRLVARKDR